MHSSSRHPVLAGTLILTGAGLISRTIGFFYRIFLSRIIGAEGIGIYQLIFPIYAFCIALTVLGLQTALSRCCAAAFAKKDTKAALLYFAAGFSISLILSILVACVISYYANPISTYILKEERCATLLRWISISIPLSTTHTCISAWYYAKRETTVPALAQILEQVVRCGFTFLIWRILLARGLAPTPLLAVFGVITGEAASAAFCILPHKFSNNRQNLFLPADLSQFVPQFRRYFPKYGMDLFRLSLPLTANRTLLTVLQSAEGILIPIHLQQYGLSHSQALSLFGVFTGMAMPFILFPSAITNSVATMLLPTVAAQQASENTQGIQDTVEKTTQYCLALGIFFLGLFFFYGPLLGQSLFGNSDAGTFLQILSFLCPFLYLTATLSSILNGLGHTFLCFVQNAAGLVIRILFVIFAIPRFGIRGYLLGLLLSQLAITLLNLFFVHREVSFHFMSIPWILIPIICMALSCGLSLYGFDSLVKILPVPLVLLLSLLIHGSVYFGILIFSGVMKLPIKKQVQ